VAWPSIAVDAPGTGNTRVYRFTNIRFDATSVKGNLVLTAITFTHGNGGTAAANLPPTLNVPTPTLRTAAPDASNAAAPPPGTTGPVAPVGAATTRYATVRFGAAAAGADHPRTIAAFAGPDTSPAPVAQNTPGTVYASESGFYNPTFGTFGPGGNLGT